MCDRRTTDWPSVLLTDNVDTGNASYYEAPFHFEENRSNGLWMTSTNHGPVGDQLRGDEVDAFEEFRRNGVDMDFEMSSMSHDRRSFVELHRRQYVDVRSVGSAIGDPWTRALHRLYKPTRMIVDDCAEAHRTVHREVRGEVDRPEAGDDAAASDGTAWSASRHLGTRRGGQCVFCRNNGESRVDYESHVVKDRTGRVTCPVLRNYVCPICSASGDDAHTIRYCPQNKHRDRAAMATAALLRRWPTAATMICDTGSSDVRADAKRSLPSMPDRGHRIHRNRNRCH